MSLRVDPVTTPRDLDQFVMFPWEVYRGDPNWVPPLISDSKKLFDRTKHPFHKHSEVQPFVARKDGQVVGRIAAIWNRNHQQFHGEDVGFFGFFECLNDGAVCRALLDAAAAWLKERGLKAMRGPASFSSNEEWGLLIDGFDGSPRVMMTYNPKWYVDLLEGAGCVKAKDLVAYWMEQGAATERLSRGAAIAAKRNPGVTIRHLNMKNFKAELDIVREIYNRSWEKNWGFVPMTDGEIDHMAAELKPVLDPDLVHFAERDGKVVGFSLSLPDAYQALKHANGRLFPFGLLKLLWYSRKIHTIRVLALGLVPEARGTGIDVMMYSHLFEVGTRKGYVAGEFSWMLEDNLAIRKPMESIGARVYRSYRVYEKPIA